MDFIVTIYRTAFQKFSSYQQQFLYVKKLFYKLTLRCNYKYGIWHQQPNVAL